MEVFNKFYSQVSSSVSSTVSQLSGVLPGNPVTREFDANCHIASAGPGLLWKIYKGSKRSTKQEAAIFVFEKRQLEKWNKADRDIILDVLRRGVTQLTKIRHPQILTVQHPLEESRESLAFATEPVFASLANVLGETMNMPQPTNLSDFKFHNIEIKYGLLQLGEGLAFLHNDVKLLHKNICPESVIINRQGAWKILGFDFCVHNANPPNVAPYYPFEDYSPTLPSTSQPNLNYTAPECVLCHSHTSASDMFSLGMLAYAVHSIGGKPIAPAKDIQQFKSRNQLLKQLSSSKLQCVPDALRDYVKMMLQVTPEVRPDAHQFIKIPYFDDIGVKTLNYLESLLQWDNVQKSQFYKGLPEALSKLPHRVKLQRVLPCLVRDLSQPVMVPFVLSSIFDIASDCSQKEYVHYILPYIKPVMKLSEPVQILLILLQRMELLLKLTPSTDVQQHVLPMLYKGLDSDVPQVHELCLSVLPTFAGLLDHANVKNSLLPRIKRLCLSTSSLSVRVNCLLCMGRLLEHLDKWLVLDEILPFLPQIPSREPAVLMGILGIYKLALNHKKLGISKEIIATRILPFLIPLCIENGLTLPQFSALVALVKQMFQIVEDDHRTKLEQLNSVQDQNKVLEATLPAVVSGTKPLGLDQAFSGLGLDSFANSLSLQEKQRLVQHQDTIKVFQNQSSLQPLPVEPYKNVSSKDLTSTLVYKESDKANSTNNSFLQWSSNTSQNSFVGPNNIRSSFTSPVVLNSPSSLFGQNVSTPPSLQNTFASPNSFGPQNTQNVFISLSNNRESGDIAWPNTSNALYNQWNGNQSTNPWASSKTDTDNWTGNQPSSTLGNLPNNPQNWSALDNLLPATPAKPSMNQMMLQKQPLLQTNNSNKSNLTQSDINDLLG